MKRLYEYYISDSGDIYVRPKEYNYIFIRYNEEEEGSYWYRSYEE